MGLRCGGLRLCWCSGLLLLLCLRVRLGWCRGRSGCTSSLDLGGSLVRLGSGNCGGGMAGLRRVGFVERFLHRLGSVRRRFSFCFVELMAVLNMILCVWPFWRSSILFGFVSFFFFFFRGCQYV